MSVDGPNAEVFPDLHLKMSKKIAQLTRVIYHLNAKNEDNAAELASFREQHDSEVSLILEDAMSKLNDFKSRLDERNASKEIEKAVQALSKKHTEEKRRAMEQFKSFKARVQDREMAISKSVQEKMTKLRTEISELKGKYEVRCTELEKLNTKLSKSSNITQSQLDELQIAHQAEMDQLVKDSNKKYQDMLMEKLDELDALKLQQDGALETQRSELTQNHNEETKTLNGRISDLQKELDDVQDTLGSKMEQLLQNVQTLTEGKLKLAEEKGVLADQVNQLQSRIIEMQQKLESKDQQLQDAQGSSTEQMAVLKRKLADQDATIQSQGSAMNALSEQIQQHMLESTALKNKLKGASTDHEKTSSLLKKQLAEATAARESAIKSLEQVQALLDATKNKMAEHIAAKVQLEEDNSRLQAQIQDLQSRVNSLVTTSQSSSIEHDQALASCRKDLTLAQQSADQLRQQIIDLEEASKTAQTKHELQLQNLIAEHAQEIELQSQTHAQTLDAAKKTLNTSQIKWQKEKNELEITINNLRKDGDGRAAALQAELQDLRDGTHKRLLEEHQIVKSELEVLRQKLNNLTALAGATENALEEQKTHCKKLQSKIDDAQKALPGQLADARKNAEEALDHQLRSEFAKTLQSEITLLRSEYEQKIAAMQADAGSQHMAEINKLTLALEKIKNELNQAREKATNSEKRHAIELQNMQTLHEQAINAIKVDAEKMANEAQQSHLRELNELQQRLEDESKIQMGDLQADFERRSKRTITEHRAAVVDLKEQHEVAQQSMTEKLEHEHKNALRAFEDQIQAKILEAKQKHTAELEAQLQELAIQKDKERSELRRALDHRVMELGRDVADLTKLCSASESREKELQAENVQIKQRLGDLRKEMDRMTKSSKKEIDSARKKLRTSHKAELESLIQEHISETELLNTEFQRLQTVMQDQNTLLEQRLGEIQELFSQRTSRPEDLERIASLQADNAKLADEVAKLMKDMKYYKLELLNREKNFNKVFNAAPNVGVMSSLRTLNNNGGAKLANSGNSRKTRGRSTRR